MATVTGSVLPVNLAIGLRFDAMLFSFATGTSTATAFTTINPEMGGRWEFQGTGFGSFVSGIPTVGSFTGIAYYENNVPVVFVTNIVLTIGQFFTFLANDDLDGMVSYVFGGPDTMTGSSSLDNLYGFGGDDVLTAGASVGDALRGGDGNDTLTGGGGFDFLFGENGNDIMTGGAGADQMDGGAGVDSVVGGAGADFLDGGEGNDTLLGGDDGDQITSTAGVDVIDGGAGSDAGIINRSQSALNYALSAEALASEAGVTLADGTSVKSIERFVITTGSGADTLTVTGPLLVNVVFVGANFFDGGAGFDRLTADLSASTETVQAQLAWENVEEVRVQGGSGDDNIMGGSGDDIISGGAGNDQLRGGTSGNSVLSGGAGNDQLFGGSGTDTLSGGDGEDFIFLSSGVAAIDGGADIDQFGYASITAAAVTYDLAGAATSTGSLWSNGTTLRNMERFNINAGDGDDILEFDADGGEGFFFGNGGFDRGRIDLSTAVGGGSFNGQTLFLNLSGFNSMVLQTQGIDQWTITGSAFADTLSSWFSDTISGGGGDDFLTGGLGIDTLNGDAGNDTINGDAGNDILSGGAGDDVVRSESGIDALDGGSGVDTLILDRSTSGISFVMNSADLASTTGITLVDGTTIRNFEAFTVRTGSGNDVMTVSAPLLSSDASLSGGGGTDRFVVDLTGYSNVLTVNGTFVSTGGGAMAISEYEEIWATGGSGDDNISGADGEDILTGGAGNDSLIGFGGNDVLSGGEGDDTLRGGIGTNVLSGGGGNDALFADFGSDTLQGGAGDDELSSSNFDGGLHVLDGGTGTDRAVLDRGGSSFGFTLDTAAMATATGVTLADGTVVRNVERFQASLGAGLNSVTIHTGLVGANSFHGGGDFDRFTADLSSLTQAITFIGSSLEAGTFSVILGAFENVSITTGAGNDQLFGVFYADVFSGGAGNDVLFGEGGDDTLQGGLGNDTLNGGDGLDTASYADAASAVRVYLALTGPRDMLGGGIDTLSSIEGVIGSAFADTLVGTTSGNLFEGGGGNDVINGLGGIDTASYAGAAGGVTVSLVLRGLQNTSGAGTDALYGIENLTGSAFNDTLEGSAGANVLTGGAGNDVITGWAGADTMDGGAGNDTLIAGNGNDTILGGDGNDLITDNSGPSTIINAGAGDDIITLGFMTSGIIVGGDGADQLNGAGSLYLLNFGGIETLNTNGQSIIATADQMESFDVIRRSAALPASVVNLALSAAGTVDLRDELFGRSVAFTGTTGSDVITTSDGNDIINGFGGHDTIDGGARNDTINGGGGNDVLIGGDGADLINGEDGIDTASYATAASGVRVNLAITTAQVTGGAGIDTLTSIEYLLGSALNDTLTGDAGANRLQGGGGDDTLNGGLGADILSGGGGADLILQTSPEGRDIIDGGAGLDTYRLTGTAEAETFRILTRAEATALGITGLVATTEIVITRNGTNNASIIAELDNIEEIEINSLLTSANNGNGTVDGGAAGGDTIIVAGDFTTTSLDYSTIRIEGSTASDTVDISGLSSAHRVVFTSNGGEDTVVGDIRPQDVFTGLSDTFGASDGLGSLVGGAHLHGWLELEPLSIDQFRTDVDFGFSVETAVGAFDLLVHNAEADAGLFTADLLAPVDISDLSLGRLHFADQLIGV